MGHCRKKRLATSLNGNASLIIQRNSQSPTSKQYKHRQKSFQSWCHLRELNPTVPSKFTLINYLADNLVLKKWKPSTLSTYASAILLLYPPSDQAEIRASPEYQEFFKSVRTNTIQPLKSYDYDIMPALRYLTSLGPNDRRLSNELLTIKTVWLLAVVGFLRPSDLARIDLDNTTVLSDNILRIIIMAPKEKRQGLRITKPITIHPHDDPLLCPVQAYLEYRSRLAHTRCMVPHPVFPDI